MVEPIDGKGFESPNVKISTLGIHPPYLLFFFYYLRMAPIDSTTMAPTRPAPTDGVATDNTAGLGDQPPERPSSETLRIAYMNCKDIYDRCLKENQDRFVTSSIPKNFSSSLPVHVKSEMILLQDVHLGSMPISGCRQGEGGPMSYLLSGGQQNASTEECSKEGTPTKRRKTEH